MVLVLAFVVAVTGCRDSDPPPSDDPGVTAPSTTFDPPTTAPSTATTALFPLDQDPPAVDLTYAQRVLDEISRLDHQASLILYREKRITPEYEALITAIYFGEALADAREAASTDLSAGLSTWRDPPGPRRATAKRLLAAKPGCIALTATSDSRPRYQEEVTVLEDIGIVLQRNIEPTLGEKRANPSLWMETIGGTIVPGKDIGEICR